MDVKLQNVRTALRYRVILSLPPKIKIPLWVSCHSHWEIIADKRSKFSNYKSNLANTDSEGTKESVRIKRVMLKSKIHLLFNQDTTEIKQDASIVKLNISKLHQAVIPRRLCP